MNYYTLFQVAPSAADKEIQKAYRVLAKKYHPDRLQQRSAHVRQQAEEKLKQINVAYDVLSDPVKRRQYDAKMGWQSGTQPNSGPTSGGPSAGGPATQKEQAKTGRRPFTQTDLHQQLAHARSEYLHYRNELDGLNKRLLNRLLFIGKHIGLVGLGVVVSTAVLGTFLTAVFNMMGWRETHTLLLWAWLLVYWLIVQIGGVLVVMNQIGQTDKLWQTPRHLARTGFVVLFSLYLTNVFTFFVAASFGGILLKLLLVHLFICIMLAQEWVRPLLTERRRLEEKILMAQDIMNYFARAAEDNHRPRW